MSQNIALSDADMELLPPEPRNLRLDDIRQSIKRWVEYSGTSGEEVDTQPLASVYEFGHERSRQALRQLLSLFVTEGLSFDDGPNYKANPRSASAAAAFVRQLPSVYRLPKIIPDDDGDIVMVWEGDQTVLVTAEGWRIHTVIDPATERSTHLPVLMFDGELLPEALLERIPLF